MSITFPSVTIPWSSLRRTLAGRRCRVVPMLAFSAAVIAGPPHITVRPMPATSETAFELEVEHHTEPGQLSVTGRAEGVRAGRRVSVPLTIVRKDAAHFTVTRQWEKNAAWVLVFSAEQGPKGSHGTAEAIISVEAGGNVQDVEYMKPVVRKDGQQLAATTAGVDRALRALGLVTAAR